MTEEWVTAVITSNVSSDSSAEEKCFGVLFLLSDACCKEAIADFFEAAEKVVEKGCTAIIASTKHVNFSFDNKNIKVLPCLKRAREIKKNAAIIEDLVKANNINIVHSSEPMMAFSAKIAADKVAVKHVTTVYKKYRKVSFKGFMFKYGMAKADLLIASSMPIAAMMKDMYRVPESKIRIVYSGVDNKQFSPDTVEEDDVRKIKGSMGIKDSEEVILFLTDCQSWRDDLSFISKALESVTEKWVLILAVTGEEPVDSVKEITDEISSLDWSDKIRVMHSGTEITPDIFALSDIVLINGEKEDSRQIIMKAEAMGKIVVADVKNQNTEIIKNGLTSFMYDDEEGLADTLVKVFAMTTKEKERMSATAINCAASDFSNSTMRMKLFKVYEELV